MRAGTLETLATLLTLSALCTSPAHAFDLENGRQIAEQRCGKCHATGKTDESPQQGLIPFRQLYEWFPIEMLMTAEKTGVVDGHDEMPMFDLGAQNARDLIAYIDSLNETGPRYLGNGR